MTCPKASPSAATGWPTPSATSASSMESGKNDQSVREDTKNT